MKDRLADIDYPYTPGHTANHSEKRGSTIASSNSQLMIWSAFVAVLGIFKWYIPMLIGTGDAHTLGMWVEEWLLVFLTGIFGGYYLRSRGFLLPFVYFGVTYGFQFQIYADDKFAFLVVGVGIVSTVLMLVGVLLGVCCKSPRDEAKAPDMTGA